MSVSLEDKFTLDKGRVFMSGIDALVRLPMLQHQRDQADGLNTAGFVSGYRGSPIGGLDQALWAAKQHTEKHNIVFNPGVNEDLAMTSVWGTQQVGMFPGAKYDGVFGMWYGKGPGLDRSMDVLKHANAAGTSKFGGVIAVVGDDHACKSSTLPHQSDHMFIGATAPVLNPAGVQEIIDYGIYGWALSRYCGCWVGIKAITDNMDATSTVDIDMDRIKIEIPHDFKLPEDGVHARWPDTPMAQEERLQRFKIYAAIEFARVNKLNKIIWDTKNPRLGIITTGKSWQDTMQALEDLGIDEKLADELGIRVYKVGMTWPLEPVTTHQFADGLDEILVVEEKRSVLEDQLTGQLYNWPTERRPRVVGEYDEDRNVLLTNLGELTPAMIARVIAQRIAKFHHSERIQKRLAFLEQKEASLAKPHDRSDRVPWYCSGCPHNTSTTVPEGSYAYGGIGCHYMATWMDRGTVTFTQMGGEGTTWIGQAPFTERKHVFQNLGDGTYFHSGLLAIRAAIASGVNITYKILYNDAVAMTGGQSIDGSLSVEQMIQQLQGEGCGEIALVTDTVDLYRELDSRYPLVTVYPREDLDFVQRKLREVSGTTILLYAQTCATEKRRRRKRGKLEDPKKRVMINPAVCEGCGDCSVKSNCLSVIPLETELGRKRQIDQSACNKDFSCLRGFCPSFVTVEGGDLRKNQTVEGQAWATLPQPTFANVKSPVNILVGGVGGTGVLTISAVLGMAAHIEGKNTSTLALTGLAQKFGAVTSHVRISNDDTPIWGARIPAGEANLLLGADLVVSAGDEAMAKVDNRYSCAVVNSYLSPTAAFVKDPDVPFPAESMKQLIREEVGAERTLFVDATDIAVTLMGDAIFANFFLLGCAWQQGLVPLTAESILEAIAMNKVAVAKNQAAFEWGRRYIVDPDRVNALVAQAKPPVVEVSKTLDEMIEFRKNYLTDYQDAAYAQRYLDKVAQVRKAESALLGNTTDLPLTEAVVRYYFKVLSYKDEYEVARLYAQTAFQAQLDGQFEGYSRIKFHLAPPMISKKDPVTGLPRKREFGGWMLHAFKLLAKFKGLRGTAFDIFGKTAERKMERALIGEYEALIDQLLGKMTADNHAKIAEAAALAKQVRGFGHVKEANVERYRKLLQQALVRLDDKEQVVKIFDTAEV